MITTHYLAFLFIVLLWNPIRGQQPSSSHYMRRGQPAKGIAKVMSAAGQDKATGMTAAQQGVTVGALAAQQNSTNIGTLAAQQNSTNSPQDYNQQDSSDSHHSSEHENDSHHDSDHEKDSHSDSDHDHHKNSTHYHHDSEHDHQKKNSTDYHHDSEHEEDKKHNVNKGSAGAQTMGLGTSVLNQGIAANATAEQPVITADSAASQLGISTSTGATAVQQGIAADSSSSQQGSVISTGISTAQKEIAASTSAASAAMGSQNKTSVGHQSISPIQSRQALIYHQSTSQGFPSSNLGVSTLFVVCLISYLFEIVELIN
jgi:hypothetical protein